MRYRRLFETAKDGILLLAAETAQSGTAAGVFICDVMGHDVCAALIATGDSLKPRPMESCCLMPRGDLVIMFTSAFSSLRRRAASVRRKTNLRRTAKPPR